VDRSGKVRYYHLSVNNGLCNNKKVAHKCNSRPTGAVVRTSCKKYKRSSRSRVFPAMVTRYL
jgi:hypothetical protein